MNTDLTFRELGQKWKPKIGRSRVHKLHDQGRIKGAYFHGGLWWAPKDTPDPRKPHGRPKAEDKET